MDSDGFTAGLKHYHRQRWRNILRLLPLYLQKQKAEDLHRLRVEIKKLTAIYHLLAYIHPAFSIQESLKQLDKIFKLSGKIRDRLNAKAFEKKFGVKTGNDKLKHKAQKATRKLNSGYNEHTALLKAVRKRNNAWLTNIKTTQLQSYLTTTKQQVITLLKANPEGKKLHECRKMLKELMYLSALETGRKKTISQREVQLIDHLQDMIGCWHDVDKFKRSLQNQYVKEQSYKSIIAEEKRLLAQVKKYANAYLQKAGVN
ncbi:MAG TPA: CHAD domain-containing protein [Chitinophagales bacterium]|nr:CHAD domain-containing protein [Chitinophagales bacterium]